MGEGVVRAGDRELQAEVWTGTGRQAVGRELAQHKSVWQELQVEVKPCGCVDPVVVHAA